MTFFRDSELSIEPPKSDDAPRPNWQVPDLIDFDYYVEADERQEHDTAAARQSLAKRDRALYLERIKDRIKEPEHTAAHRRLALRIWLAERRRGEDPALRPLLPGASFARGQRIVTMLLVVLGLITGGTVASALLQYDGVHPVNVSWFIFVLVILQLLLAGGTVTAWAMRRSKSMQQALRDVSLLAHLIRPLFSKVAHWIQRHRLAQMPPEVRDRANARQGLLQSHFSLYGPASYLPMLIPVQAFGIGFNIGAIVMTVLLEWFSDLAFGWGSALNVEPTTIFALAKFIALPWSWLFGEGIGYPTLAEIAGTRIHLKDPLFLLDAEHLRAWRWFLVLALISYGLIPRLLLLGLSALTQRHALDRLPFTHQKTQALYTRLVTPDLDTGLGKTGSGPEMPIPGPLKPLTSARAAPRPEPPSEQAAPRVEPPPETPVARIEQTPEATATSASTTAAQAPTEPSVAQPKASPPSTSGAQTDTRGRDIQETRHQPSREAAPQSAPPQVAEPPTVRTTPKPEKAPTASADKTRHNKVAAADQPRVAPDACVLLLHVDVADVLEESDHGRLQQRLRQCSGWQVAASATYGGGTAMADQAIALITDNLWEAPPPRIALVDDGSQPPITERLRFLRRVRAAAGDQAQILVTLIGDPDGDDPLPPVTEFDFGDWQRKIEQLADPYLRLTMLTPRPDDQPPAAAEIEAASDREENH